MAFEDAVESASSVTKERSRSAASASGNRRHASRSNVEVIGFHSHELTRCRRGR